MEQAIGERETETFLKFSGLMRAEEIRTMPILERASVGLISGVVLGALLGAPAASAS